MSHELSFQNGVAEMAFLLSEGACWHGFGQGIEDDATREQWYQASNIANWSIDKHKAIMMINGALHRVPNTLHLTRSDNNHVLATVSEQFNIHQPKEVGDWMFELVEKLGFKMSTMGVLFDGKVFWCQADIGQTVNIGGIDRVDGKLLIKVPNTGKDATVINYSKTRVVCNNTLREAMSTGHVLKINHMSAFNTDEINDKLGVFDLQDWGKTAEKMAQIKITETQVLDYLGRVFKVDYSDVTTGSELLDNIADDTERNTAHADVLAGILDAAIAQTEKPVLWDIIDEQEQRAALAADNKTVMKAYELFCGAGIGSDMPTAKDTLWGAVNAVTEFVDHRRNTRTWDSRFDSAQFGQWAHVKDIAWEEAILMM